MSGDAHFSVNISAKLVHRVSSLLDLCNSARPYQQRLSSCYN